MTATLTSRFGVVVQRSANRVLQFALVAALLAGVRRRDPSVIINGLVSIAFAVTPRFLEGRYSLRFRPWQRLWVSTAALVHTLGMLGPYDRIWWWDHLAHTLSGVVVAGIADVIFRADVETADRSTTRSRPEFVVGATLGAGLLWEALEYAVHAAADRAGFEPLLVHYGRLDAVGDVLFDVVGAALVVVFGRRSLSNVVDSAATSLDDASGVSSG